MAAQTEEADPMEAARRFEQWRSSRSGKSPIPDELWKLAIDAARQQGVNRTAQQLHLDAGKLKRLIVAADKRKSKTPRRPRLVELVTPPAATQWEIVEELAEVIKPARDELIRQAAQGEVLHNDDTGMRVLKLEREPGDQRTGVFTSGIISTAQGRKIALCTLQGGSTPERI